jgi:hypothetical protein
MRYGYSFRKIKLTNGQITIVDAKDFERLAGYRWYAVKAGRRFYAHRKRKSEDERHRFIKMHRQILEVPEGKFVDHINHNGLDNRRANLRIVTKEQNNWNKRKKLGNYSSQYKGVSRPKNCGKWRAKISYRGKGIFIGYFDDEESAARAYDEKARELFGEYAMPNFSR